MANFLMNFNERFILNKQTLAIKNHTPYELGLLNIIRVYKQSNPCESMQNVTSTPKTIADQIQQLNVLLEEQLTLEKKELLCQHSQITNAIKQYKKNIHELHELEETTKHVKRSVLNLHAHISVLEKELSHSMLQTSRNGVFLWLINDVENLCNETQKKHINYFYSSYFYTHTNGYKMHLRVYFNECGSKNQSYFSVFLIVVKGEYDPILQWPFYCKACITLLDQSHSYTKNNIVKKFQSGVGCTPFQRPTSSHNTSTGFVQFALIDVLKNTKYVNNNTMYIKCVVHNMTSHDKVSIH